ncbi:MAG: phytoene/squalene synthase family protein [Planctomycetaceae bacterium]|nr:phytoene/squalene synthase family protein [Planctomycetaceae bacterium]
MNHAGDLLKASYAECRRVSRRSGSTFYAGFWLLPAEQRRAMEALYAFLRQTDDLADAGPSGPAACDALIAWRAALRGVLDGPSPADAKFPLSLLALADAVQRFQIPHELLFAAIDGVEMDLSGRRYDTFEQLEVYCDRVASAVGLACIHIWGFRGPEALRPARQIGVAMQLTNILRDLNEDAAVGRVYLPLDDLRQCDYSIDNLTRSVVNERFSRLMELETSRAERLYRDGAALFDWLEPPGRRIFGLMTTTYHGLLQKIAARPAEVFRRRVRLGRLQKARLWIRWAFCPPRKLF